MAYALITKTNIENGWYPLKPQLLFKVNRRICFSCAISINNSYSPLIYGTWHLQHTWNRFSRNWLYCACCRAQVLISEVRGYHNTSGSSTINKHCLIIFTNILWWYWWTWQYQHLVAVMCQLIVAGWWSGLIDSARQWSGEQVGYTADRCSIQRNTQAFCQAATQAGKPPSEIDKAGGDIDNIASEIDPILKVFILESMLWIDSDGWRIQVN